jgi:hypothetical protein
VSLRVVHAEGDAAARGRAIGESLGDLIHRSLAFYRGYLEGQSIRDLERTLAPYWAAAERAFPEHTATITATAAAAGVPTHELFAVNACEELPLPPRPSAAPRSRRSLLAQRSSPTTSSGLRATPATSRWSSSVLPRALPSPRRRWPAASPRSA